MLLTFDSNTKTVQRHNVIGFIVFCVEFWVVIECSAITDWTFLKVKNGNRLS